MPNEVYNYDLVDKEYDIGKNRISNTYDQFIMLRDTLVYSKKHYKWKAWATLVIGDTEETVEVKYINKRIQKMNPNWKNDPQHDLQTYFTWPYISQDWIDLTVFGILSCRIEQDWYYRIWHKEEVIEIPADAIQVRCYVELFEIQEDGSYPTDPDSWALLPWIPIAVFDRQADISKTFWGYTNNTEPNGTCSITVNLTLWELIQKMTSFGLIERNLKRWDILALRMVYRKKPQTPTADPEYVDVTLQSSRSNRWSVEYLSLPLKD